MSDRILLLSLSGVRIVDDGLRALGLTLPGFIERGKTIASLPNLGLLTLAGVTPSRFEVSYLEWDQLPLNPAESIAADGYDLVALSALTARIYEAYRLSDRLREHGVKVVLGGLHVSVLPDEAEAHADAVVVGQGEEAWPTLLRDFENGRLQKRYSGSRQFRALSRSSETKLPRYDLISPDDYNRIPLQTTRGCPLDCTFCGASRLISNYQVAQEGDLRRQLETILDLWPRPFLELADDNTFASKKHAKMLANLLAEYPLRWFTETDISVADDEELLDSLAQSGCAQLLIGLESSSRDSLREVDSQSWKWARAEQYRRQVEKIQDRGITVNGCFVLGFDQDDESVFDRTFEMVRELSLAEVQITLLTPFPGTALAKRLREEGRLFSERYWDKCTLFDVTYEPKLMSPTELRDGFLDLMGRLYSDDSVRGRKERWKQSLKERRTGALQ